MWGMWIETPVRRQAPGFQKRRPLRFCLGGTPAAADSPEALAERISYLIEHPERWPEMGRAGRSYVEEHHDIRKLNEQLVSIYESVLAGRYPDEQLAPSLRSVSGVPNL